MTPNPIIVAELRSLIHAGVAAGKLLTQVQISASIEVFRRRFGPQALRGMDGPALLQMMHGRAQTDSRCLAYWLEFKNDEEFAGYRFGGIGGGSALKYEVFQRAGDGAWVTGGPQDQRVIEESEAIEIARRQRDELVRGCDILEQFDTNDLSDEAYGALQRAMERVAPLLSGAGWAHKYWFLLYSSVLDDYHNPKYQRFHLLKLLELPPDGVGILDRTAPRFLCAGRFIRIARELDVHVSTLNRALNQRDQAIHRYWRVGTTEGEGGDSLWSSMRDGNQVSLGWKGVVTDLTLVLSMEKPAAREEIRRMLARDYGAAIATRKSGEILNLAREMSEDDLIIACEGQQVLGIGRVTGPYEYDDSQPFPHRRPVAWISREAFRLPQAEGPHTTVYELGKFAKNILAIEEKLFASRSRISAAIREPPGTLDSVPLQPLDPIAARLENILRRKGQAILYGPPGTGKTFHAIATARELAARQAFSRSFASLDAAGRAAIEGGNGMVRVCTFHPGYSYEDFVEGLRPSASSNGHLEFKPRNGIFKQLCDDSRATPARHFFLVIDEINRGDVARILGELMTILEQDKRGTSVILPITQLAFSVPPNVFILATMNTADRSISLLDAALRRRFGFLELMPASAALKGLSAGAIPLGPWLDALNARLRQHLKRDARNLQIGHSYLMTRPPITSVAEFSRVLRDEIIPLLEEYCYDDFHMLREILGGDLVDVERGSIREEIFASNREDDLVKAVSFEQMESLTLSESEEDESGEPESLVPDAE